MSPKQAHQNTPYGWWKFPVKMFQETLRLLHWSFHMWKRATAYLGVTKALSSDAAKEPVSLSTILLWLTTHFFWEHSPGISFLANQFGEMLEWSNGSQLGIILFPREHLVLSRDIWGCHNGARMMNLMKKAMDTAKFPTMLRIPPIHIQKNYHTKNINMVRVRNPGLSPFLHFLSSSPTKTTPALLPLVYPHAILLCILKPCHFLSSPTISSHIVLTILSHIIIMLSLSWNSFLRF
jgi:hypothetical protein